MSEDHTFNGWPNRETWCVNLWLTNDEGPEAMVREAVNTSRNNQPDGDRWELADYLRRWIEDDDNPLADDATLYSDMLGHALRLVDWDYLASHYLDAFPPETSDESGEEE